MAEFTFWIVVGITLGSAFMVVQSKNLVYSAYALLFSFIGVTGLYVFLWADFIAVVQVVVYVGGILSHASVQKKMGAVAVLGMAFLLGYMVISTPWVTLANVEPAETTAAIGRLLMMDYLLPFEVASLLLLGALIGATTLSRKED